MKPGSLFDDLHIWPARLPLSTSLTAFFQDCRQDLEKVYDNTDREALQEQKSHRQITLFAAVFGTTAVLLAIVQLSGLFPQAWSRWGEAVAAVIAVVAVGLGISSAAHQTWLLQRHKAERCRLLKFELLTDPVLWGENQSLIHSRLEQFCRSVGEIDRLSRQDLNDWVQKAPVPPIPPMVISPLSDSTAFAEFVTYYLEQRLVVQKEFFKNRYEKNDLPDKYTRRWPSSLFFVSILCALIHFLYDLLLPSEQAATGNEHHHFSLILIALAAALPTVGAGIRTYRSAYEFARNTIRYHAKYTALEQLEQRLRSDIPIEEQFQNLWRAEQILDSEHREWLGLMIEAEWYG